MAAAGGTRSAGSRGVSMRIRGASKPTIKRGVISCSRTRGAIMGEDVTDAGRFRRERTDAWENSGVVQRVGRREAEEGEVGDDLGGLAESAFDHLGGAAG